MNDKFIATWKARKVGDLCEENAASKINCYDSFGKSRFCVFENAMVRLLLCTSSALACFFAMRGVSLAMTVAVHVYTRYFEPCLTSIMYVEAHTHPLLHLPHTVTVLSLSLRR